MPDTTPNTEQETVSAPPAVVDVETAPKAAPAPQPQGEQKVAVMPQVASVVEQEDDEQDDEQEEPEVPRTEFMNLKEALIMGQAQLKRIPHLNPESLRRFLLADLYPILIEIADYANWYVGDLHNRVMGIEIGESDGFQGEALSPETAEQLINFVGMSLQIFGVILQSPKADPRLIQTAQLLTAQAPGLIAKVQDITMSEEPDEEDYEDEDEEEEEEEDGIDSDNGQSAQSTKVLEPHTREPVQIAVPAAEAAPEPTNKAAAETPAEPKAAETAEPAAAAPAVEPAVETDAGGEEGKSDG